MPCRWAVGGGGEPRKCPTKSGIFQMCGTATHLTCALLRRHRCGSPPPLYRPINPTGPTSPLPSLKGYSPSRGNVCVSRQKGSGFGEKVPEGADGLQLTDITGALQAPPTHSFSAALHKEYRPPQPRDHNSAFCTLHSAFEIMP